MKKIFLAAFAIVAMSAAFTSCDKFFGKKGTDEVVPPAVENVDTIKTAAGDADSLIITTYADGTIDTLVVGDALVCEGDNADAAPEADTAQPTDAAQPADDAPGDEAPAEKK